MNEHLWLHWTHCSASCDKIKVFCNYCNATKCREHTIKCSKTPKNIKKLFKYEVIQLRKKSIKFEDIGESDVEVIGKSSEVPVLNNSLPVPSPDAEENGSIVEMRPRSQ